MGLERCIYVGWSKAFEEGSPVESKCINNILFATGVPGKLFDKVRVPRNAGSNGPAVPRSDGVGRELHFRMTGDVYFFEMKGLPLM
jgi:hypothetical protein